MQRHRPTTATRLQCTADRARFCGPPLEHDCKVLVFGTLTDEAATEMTVIADLATNHRSALERIEGEPPFAYGHKALRRRSTGAFCRDNRTDPATLQAVPRQNPTGLQMFTQVCLTAAGNAQCENPATGGP